MPATPNPDMDERVAIPLDPETALRGLLQVQPEKPGDDERENNSHTKPPEKPRHAG
jgi:hypothetical protein